MATAVDALQGLLAPWMTGANPSALDNTFQQYGGTQGLLDAMMQANTPQAFGAANQAVQSQALQNAAARQGLAQGSIGLQRSMMMLPLMQSYYGGLLGILGGQTGQQSPTDTSATDSTAQGAQADASASPAQAPAPAASPAPSASPVIPASPSAAPRGADPLALARVGAFGGAIGAPGASGLLDYAKLAAQYSPQLATQMKVAADPLTIDRAMMQDAAAHGDNQGLLSAYTKYLTDANRLHISSMSGNVTGFGLPSALIGGMTNYNPTTGKLTAGGKQSLIPGAAETEAALERARAGAEESARLGAELAPPGARPQGPASVPSAPATAPQGTLQGQAALDTAGYVPPILAAPAKVRQNPGNLGALALVEQQKDQVEKAGKVQEDLQEQAENSQMLLTQAQQIEASARDFTPGRYAVVKGEILSALQPTGLLTDTQLKELGSYQEGQKLSIQLQALATKQLGSREAAQVFSVMGKSIPNLTLSPDGLGKISAYMEGIARYNVARAEYSQRLAAQGNVAGVNSLPQVFQSHSNPAYYILAAASTPIRAEILSSMPNRSQFVANWKRAAEQGLAPGPFDYEGR